MSGRRGRGAPRRAPRRLERPIVAVVERHGRFLTARTIFDRHETRVTLDNDSRHALTHGELVLVGPGKKGPRVLRSLGSPEVARDVVEGHMLERGLRRTFPRKVSEQAAEIRPVDSNGRRDLTDLATFTIDPTTARDFDDAISAERIDGGGVRVWVHIADVSAYVRPGSALDREAYRRGTSVYVPGAVEPMLPEALSNQACSLVPGEDRLTVTVEMDTVGDEVRSARFYRSTIRSDTRLDYDRVDRVFAGSEQAQDPWARPLEAARELAQALAAKRERMGSLEITSSEHSFEFDDAGNVTGTRLEEQTESHELIEHLMILANEQVAGYLADRKAPALFRVHEKPEPAGVEALADKLASLGVPTPALPDNMSPQQAGEAVGEMSRLVAAHVRRTGTGRGALGSLVLRSLKQAYYTPRNLGHHGLASPRYCHFTSPIRRYPDLIVHRALLASLGIDDSAPRGDEMPEAGVDTSERERDAVKIERDADDICGAFLLQRAVAERGAEKPFSGEVVGLVGSGAFIAFGDEQYGRGAFEGFLPVRRMKDDWWALNEEETALVGSRSGRAVRLGDDVEVLVGRIEAPRGRVDLDQPGEDSPG